MKTNNVLQTPPLTSHTHTRTHTVPPVSSACSWIPPSPSSATQWTAAVPVELRMFPAPTLTSSRASRRRNNFDWASSRPCPGASLSVPSVAQLPSPQHFQATVIHNIIKIVQRLRLIGGEKSEMFQYSSSILYVCFRILGREGNQPQGWEIH